MKMLQLHSQLLARYLQDIDSIPKIVTHKSDEYTLPGHTHVGQNITYQIIALDWLKCNALWFIYFRIR